MTFINGLKDFVGGLTRGFSLFFNERNDYVIAANIPSVSNGVSAVK